ncbi:hypothetical protein BSL78_18960 [Apostichopus japonicus]|uniref:Uncharacterized protein n=1 Tax=Stichopus japonicus TaxID=307972 RepID=A0A2G8K871_STIJA|nr:hypothetical protein BSL78_18960 [Apostichopus japonicus]
MSSGNYFGFSHTGFSQQQQGSYGQHGASAHQGSHVFTPSAASPHTSYVVASTARPSAAAAYETTYTAQPASQYYSATPQRQDTTISRRVLYKLPYSCSSLHHVHRNHTDLRKADLLPATPAEQPVNHLLFCGGGGTAVEQDELHCLLSRWRQSAESQASSKLPERSRILLQSGYSQARPTQASLCGVGHLLAPVTLFRQLLPPSSSYGGNKKYNSPAQQAPQQPHYNSGGGGGGGSAGGGDLAVLEVPELALKIGSFGLTVRGH